jgi:hypothetical protein
MVVLAFKLNVGQRNQYVAAWRCPYCGASEHRHASLGLQESPCGRGLYLVRWSGGRIVG